MDLASATEQTLAALEQDNRLIVLETFSQSSLQTTEFVRDPQSGRLLVRKSITFEDLEELNRRQTFFATLIDREFPHCATCRSALALGDLLVLTFDYIEGIPLEDYMTDLRKHYNPQTRLTFIHKLFNELGDAVESLHVLETGPLIHRDINPRNIIVGPQGCTLIDLGIARTWDHGKNVDTNLLGTNGYAAPEQYGFGQTSTRSDIYSLGMVLYYCLSGKRPTNNLSTSLVSDLDYLAFEPIITRAIALDPAARYVDVSSFVAIVDECFHKEEALFPQTPAMNTTSVQEGYVAPSLPINTARKVHEGWYQPKSGAGVRALAFWNGVLYCILGFVGLVLLTDLCAPSLGLPHLSAEHPLVIWLYVIVFFVLPSLLALDYFHGYMRVPVLRRFSLFSVIFVFIMAWVPTIAGLSFYLAE